MVYFHLGIPCGGSWMMELAVGSRLLTNASFLVILCWEKVTLHALLVSVQLWILVVPGEAVVVSQLGQDVHSPPHLHHHILRPY